MKQVIICLITLIFAVQIIIAQTTFHGNIARTGIYESAGPTQLKGIKWQFKTEGAIFSSPAIANGVIFVGSSDSYFYAVDQKTGQQKWKFKTTGPVNSSPAVANGIVYFTSFDGGFYALDAETGTSKWRFRMEYERRFQAKGLHGQSPRPQLIPDTWDFFTSSPVVFNGRVYFGSGDGNVYSLNAETGLLQWKFETKDVVHASPAIANNMVYIGSWDGNLYALDTETGAEKWRFKGGEDPINYNQIGFQSSPIVVDGTIYVGCRDSHLYAIDAATGRKKWDYYFGGTWASATPTVRDGLVYMVAGRFYALDVKTGRLRFTFDEPKDWSVSSPILAGDLAYIGGFNGRLYSLDAKSGKLVWEFQTEASKKDVLKVLTPEGRWNPASFAPVFNDFEDMYVSMYKRYSTGSILSSPVVDQGEIYFGSTDGFLYALQ